MDCWGLVISCVPYMWTTVVERVPIRVGRRAGAAELERAGRPRAVVAAAGGREEELRVGAADGEID